MTRIPLGPFLVLSAIVCACGIGQEEVASSTRQALSPQTFDLPDHGETKIRTGVLAKPGEEGGGVPGETGFCFFMRIKGPFVGQPPFDHSNIHGLDSFVSILPVDGEWVGEISSATPTPEVSIGCIYFHDFLNAGHVETEGLTLLYNVGASGGGFPSTIVAPDAAHRTPSFCTFNFFKGNMYRPYGNCSSDSAASVDTDASPSRSEDSAIISAKGMYCAAIDYPVWCITCPNDQPEYESTVETVSACDTRWSGMSGKQLVQFGSVNVPSTTTPTPLIKREDGVCWISGITDVGGAFGAASEEASIVLIQQGTETWWAIQSTTAGSAYATCVKTDQSQ